MSRRQSASSVYIGMEAARGFGFLLFGTVFALHVVVDAGLDAFRLLILGTALEATVLIFEVPTGLVADAVGRRFSVILGFVLTGLAFGITATDHFGLILGGQVLWGLGYTFGSGAKEAWITDEVGEERAHRLYLRAAQAAQLLGLAGIVASVALATIWLGLPILVAGAVNLAIAATLAVVMPERAFIRRRGGGMVTAFRSTFGAAVRDVRGRPVLLLIFAVAAFHGLSTEGFDRLFQLHLLRGTGVPPFGELDPIVWFGVLEAVALLLAILTTEFIRRRVDISSHRGAAGTLAIIDIGLIGSVVVFALTGRFLVAVCAFWVVALLREVREPVITAWINQGLDPASRATVNSMAGQADAVGQIAAGPAIGILAVARSVPAAIVVSGLLRAPALLLFGRALRRGTAGTLPAAAIDRVPVEPGEPDVPGLPGPP